MLDNADFRISTHMPPLKDTGSLILANILDIKGCNLIDMLNANLAAGQVPHKGGDADDSDYWRPSAILNITYKILALLVYNILRATLDQAQSGERFGFRAKR